MKNVLALFLIFFIVQVYFAEAKQNQKNYKFRNDPIDVVIPAVDKDIPTLNMCIEGIRKNCKQVRRIIVVSARPLTDKAEWFNEAIYPFDKKNVALHLFHGDQKAASDYLSIPGSRVGWYYQQLLKLYAPYIIPNISSNVLILDSDTIFLKPVQFLNAKKGGLYNPGSQNNPPYFTHAKRLIPWLKRLYPEYSGISNVMLFQKPVLDDLFKIVKKKHKMKFWKAFCQAVCLEDIFAGASEYEIYFNFVFSKTKQVGIRPLKFADIHLSLLRDYEADGYDYVSCHAWMR